MKFPITFSIPLVLLAAAATSHAQVAISGPEKGQPLIVRMTLHPVPTTRPALAYPLLPEAIAMTPGDAAFLWGVAANLGPTDPKLSELLNKPYSDMPLRDLAASGLPADLASFANRTRFADLAARRGQAKWDSTIREDGVSALLPYLNPLRRTATLLGWRARLEVAKHDWAAANYTFQSGLSLTRQLNHDAVLVQGLVACGISALMLDRMQEWIAEPGAPNLYWSLSNLPQPFLDPRSAGQTERAMIYYTFPELNQPDPLAISAEQWRQVVQRLDVLSSFQPKSGSQSALGEQVGRALFAASIYPKARQQLVSMGISEERLQGMSVDQTVGIYFLIRYRELSDECYKAWALPYWQGAEPMERAMKEVQAEQKETRNPLLILLPSVQRGRLQFARIDRQICLLRVIEALRDYAARHENRAPASLDQVTDLPLPTDPVTGKGFSFESHGQSAVITAPEGSNEPGVRYELTFSR
jgi:hypothetical protein